MTNPPKTIQELEAELAAARLELSALRAAQTDALTASQATLRGVLDSATSGIVACTAIRDGRGVITDFRFTLANPMSEKMLFHTVDEMVGNTLLTLFPGNIESGLFDGYVRVTETGVPMEVETYYQDDRLEFWLNVSAVRVDDGVAITFTDITEHKRAERMKDQFLSILSHELRTPINAIMGFGSVLADEVPGPLNDEQRRFTGRILGGAETLLALINDLLDMSRLQAGEFTLEPRAIDAHAVLQDTAANLLPLADKKGQTVVVTPDGGPAIVSADPQRLAQILVNLLGNAIKFTPDGGRIGLRTRREAGRLVFEVQDTGVGIAPKDIGLLFRPFTQLDAGLTRDARGTGLGLSIAKALVEAHGGEIGVESVLGEGTTFRFHLPMPD